MADDSTKGADVVAVRVGTPAPGGVAAVALVPAEPAPARTATWKHMRGEEPLACAVVPVREDGSVTIDFPTMRPGDVITVSFT